MHGFLSSIFGLFLSPVGLVVLAALDSSLLFFLPAALDTAVVVMSARNREWFLFYALLAAVGSTMGAYTTYVLGEEIGEAGLQRWLSPRRLKKVQQKLGERGVIAMGLAALLPPPFPLTPFVLTSGALELDRRKFFATLLITRFVRFGIEGALARIYGRAILGWFQSDVFEFVISALMIIALTGTAITIVKITRRVR